MYCVKMRRALSVISNLTMARHGNHDRRAARKKRALAMAKNIEALSIYMMVTADDEDDELIAIIVALLALDHHKNAKKSGKYGPRGRYDRAKSQDFFELVIEAFTDRQFKEFMR